MQTVTEERPFYWACGKCRGAGLYRDDDRLVGDFSIVCPICGNRYYGDVGGRVRGLAPVITYYTIESAPLPFRASHFILARTANIVTGPARSGARTIKKEEEPMTAQPRKRPCKNCNRVLTIVSDGCCYVCYHAGKGLDVEEKAAARAAVKEKIESGRLKKAGGSGRRKAAPKDPASPPAKTDKRKRACVNCGRVRFIYREDLCGLCSGAAKDLAGDERAVALAEIKRKIESGEIGTGKRRSPSRKVFSAQPPADKAPRQLSDLAERKEPGKFTFAAARVVEGVQVISIDFADERDRKIYDALIGQAARLRRTPEQQILWMLQNAMEQETGLLAEASGR